MVRILKYIAAVSLILCIIFILLEIYLRLFNPHPYIYKELISRYLFQKDDLLGYSLTPHFNTKFRDIDIKINSLGLRDGEYAYEKAKNSFRILVLGGSNT